MFRKLRKLEEAELLDLGQFFEKVLEKTEINIHTL